MRHCVSMDHKQHTLGGEMTGRAQTTVGLSDYHYSELKIAPDPLWYNKKAEKEVVWMEMMDKFVSSPHCRVSRFSVFAHLGMPYLC